MFTSATSSSPQRWDIAWDSCAGSSCMALLLPNAAVHSTAPSSRGVGVLVGTSKCASGSDRGTMASSGRGTMASCVPCAPGVPGLLTGCGRLAPLLGACLQYPNQ